MPRPRKSMESTWIDIFADWPVEEQASALRILQELHRQKLRESGRKPKFSLADGIMQAVEHNHGVAPPVPSGDSAICWGCDSGLKHPHRVEAAPK